MLITLNCQAWFTRGYLLILWLILFISQDFIHCFLCSRLYAKWYRYIKAKANTLFLKVRAQSCPTLCNFMDRLPCAWDFPGKNTGLGCHFLLQGIFPTLELNLSLAFLPWHRFFTTVPPGKSLSWRFSWSPFIRLNLMKKIHQWTSSFGCSAVSAMTQRGPWFSNFFNLKEKQRHWPTISTQ